MSRALITTGTPGWFAEVTPDGVAQKRTRKQDGDSVYDNVIEAQAALEQPQANGNRGTEAAKQAVQTQEPQTTVAETGRVLTGKTLTIKCKWRGCDKIRTIKPQDKFQVRYCAEHQQEHRKQVRREKQRKRSAERRSAREAAVA